ncbi:hypothetical protein BN977_05870 [Mycolicibacterium cosmeticum]|uniref:Uncharacterized protein n=1 Tax=Mycolicibacterium cosmeticum TaxID=258533 RepID=W9AYX9_MYCCO|nr:hypothetical protein BN977_05870 [Mycolicibacterium cosmeticum]
MSLTATDHSPAPSLLRDELDGLVSTLETRFPGHSRVEITQLVTTTYHRLAAGARITAHLIPLTLNVSRRALTQQQRSPAGSADMDGLPRRQTLNVTPALDLDRRRPGGIGGDVGFPSADHQMQPMAAVPQ